MANRPNWPPVANKPVVVQVHGASHQKAGKLPEWASFTAAVTGVTIFAFATSSFYVFGLSYTLKKPLAVYFSPTDYLRITPSWAIPTLATLCLGALIVGICLLSFAGGVYLPWVNFMAIKGKRPADATTGKRRRYLRYFIVFGAVAPVLGLVVVAAVVFWATYLQLAFPLEFAICAVVAVSLGAASILSLIFSVPFLPGSAVVRLPLAIILWCMLFALFLGGIYEPRVIQVAPLTRVLFESEKDRVAAVEGKVIFDLERYVLLRTEDKSGKPVAAIPHKKVLKTVLYLLSHPAYITSEPKFDVGSVIAIPHEKIKSIQTPPLPKEQESGGD